jgi:hypothetical protein
MDEHHPTGAAGTPGAGAPRAHTPEWWWDPARQVWVDMAASPPQAYATAPPPAQLSAQQHWEAHQAAQQWQAQQYAARRYAEQQWAAQQYAAQQYAAQQWAAQQEVVRRGGGAKSPASSPRHRVDVSAIAAVGIVAAIVLLLIAVPIMLAEHSELPVGDQAGPVVGPKPPTATPGPAASRTASDDGSPFKPSIRPSRRQIAFFSEVGFSASHNDRLIRWDSAVVEVDVRGAKSWVERDLVMNVIDELNGILDAPHFTLIRTTDPDIVVHFVSHERFLKLNTLGDDVIGFCRPQWNVRSGEIGDAVIVIDNGPSVRSYRRGVLYHEFAHGLGLSDTSLGRYGATVMYAYANGVKRFTPLDRAALRMLYDPRLDPGDRRPEAIRMWRNIP